MIFFDSSFGETDLATQAGQKDWKVCGLESKNGKERPLLPEARQDISKRELSLETTLQRIWNVGMKLARIKGNSNSIKLYIIDNI